MALCPVPVSPSTPSAKTIQGNLPGGIYKTGSAHATNFFFDAKDIGDLAGDRISESSRLSSSSFAMNLFPLYSTHHRGSRKLAASRISKCKLTKLTTKLTIILWMVFGFRKLGMLSPRDHAPTGLPALSARNPSLLGNSALSIQWPDSTACKQLMSRASDVENEYSPPTPKVER